MRGKVVLVCTDRARTWRHVAPPLAGAGNQLVHAQTTDRSLEFLRSGAVDLALVEWRSGVDLDQVLAAAGQRVPVAVVVSETGIRALEELICRRGLLHLCAARPEIESSAARLVDPAELVVTCEKILRRDIFGLDKYLAGFGIERPTRTVKRADERDALIGQLTEAARALGAGRRVVESVSLVADELLTNAVYNAPRDAHGTPRYAHTSRRNKIALDPAEYVRVEFGSDGCTFGLAVNDSFGALQPASVRGSIERCIARQDPIDQKPGGAGIGLYAALCHADHLVFNVAPGLRTEVIALWSLTRKSGGRGAGVASLHMFECAEIAAGQGAAAAEASVELSEAVKGEIFAALVEGGEERMFLGEPLARPRTFDTVRDAALAAADEVAPATEPATPAKDAAPDVCAATAAEAAIEPAAEAEPPASDEAAATGEAEAGEEDAASEEADREEGEPRVAVSTAPEPARTGTTMEVDPDMVLAAELEPVDSGSMTPVRDSGVWLEVESGMMLALDSDDEDADEDAYVGVEPDPESDGAGESPGALETMAEAEAAEAESAYDIDMADLYEMATMMEATGLLPSAGPPWLGPLTSLRGVKIPRRSDGPGFEAALARIRAAATLADAVEVLLSYLVGRWSAALLLCRVGGVLVPWAAAGDVDGWDELCELEVPLGEGWLSARGLAPGVTLAALDDDLLARRLSDLLTSQGADQGLALSLVVDQAGLVVFACRWAANAPGDSATDYEELQRELSELTARFDRFSRLPTMRRQSARAGGW